MLKLFISDDISIISIVIFIVMLLASVWLGVFTYRALKYKSGKVELYNKDTDFDGIKEGDARTPFGMHVIIGLIFLFCLWYAAFGFPLTKKLAAVWYEEEVRVAKEQLEIKFANVSDDVLVQMGESVFNTNCVTCHGVNGRGLGGIATDLSEFGTEDHIIYTIKAGSKGHKKLTPLMPPQWAALGASDQEREESAKNIAAYVMSFRGLPSKKGGDVELGKQQFALCAACHGFSGKGMGPADNINNFAANLVSYGSHEYIMDIVLNGKDGIIGTMPSFSEVGTLSDIQVKAVSLYVERSLRR